jgi:hypothetical protein
MDREANDMYGIKMGTKKQECEQSEDQLCGYRRPLADVGQCILADVE